jgi:Zn-dependent protease
MLGNLSIAHVLLLVVVVLVSLTVHEMMHALVGFKLGDDTAAEKGRITLNPLAHIDPVMTILLPIISIVAFGTPILAAKPVPFNPERVKWDEFGGALIALAGPLSNLVLAVAASLLAGTLNVVPDTIITNILLMFISVNVSLFVFNLIPIPPLDGSRVLFAFAPDPLRRVMEQLEPYGLFIVFGIVLVGGFSFLGHLIEAVFRLLPLNPFLV